MPVHIRNQSDPNVVGYKRDASGRVTGNRFLHGSATYTEGFGRALLQAWNQPPVVAVDEPVPLQPSARARGRGRGRPGAAAPGLSCSVCHS